MASVALIQMDLTAGRESSLAKAQVLLRQASGGGATMAVFPELFPYPWFAAAEESRYFSMAEPQSGIIVSTVRQWAQDLNLTIILPTYEVDGSHRFNTSYVISSQGDVVGRYRKAHIPYHPGWLEKYYYEPGDSRWPVFYHDGLTFGIQTCWDNLFPEGSRILGLKGVHLIVAPRGTGDYSRERWRTALAANAMANNCFVASVNRVGQEGAYPFGGDSFVAHPSGVITPVKTEGDEVLIVPLDLTEVYDSRREWPFRYDRRPELYGPLAHG
jgi:N-carbamoylputrescine amidase